MNYEEVKEIGDFKKIPLGRAKDLRNEKFGRLQPIYRMENVGGETQWLCKCDCGTLKRVSYPSMQKGKTVSCGCYHKEVAQNNKALLEDLTGRRFGRLIVLGLSKEKRRNRTTWTCQCDCGNIIDVVALDLKSGDTKSCGCYKIDNLKNNATDLTNLKFGKLTVKYRNGSKTLSDGRNYPLWHCICECGNEIDVISSSLLNQNTQSCGNCLRSIGEYNISNILDKYNIPYKYDIPVPEVKFKKDSRSIARFDFYVNNSYYIEFDGLQHETGWGGDEDDLEKQKKHDGMKNNYCKENNIPLIRIPYSKRDNIKLEDLVLETSKYRIV